MNLKYHQKISIFDDGHEGTLLHKATHFRSLMTSYVSLLLKDGTDTNVVIRRQSYDASLHIATESNNYDLLSLFLHVKSNDKSDDKSDDTAQEVKEKSKKQEEKRKINENHWKQDMMKL